MKLSYKQRYVLSRNVLAFLGLAYAYAKLLVTYLVKVGIVG